MVNGSRAAAPKGTMFCIKTSISTPSDLEAGGQRLEARGWRPEAGGWRPEAGREGGDIRIYVRMESSPYVFYRTSFPSEPLPKRKRGKRKEKGKGKLLILVLPS